MKKMSLFFFAALLILQTEAQKVITPDILWNGLFVEVQLKRVFPDNKTFVDAVPKAEPPVVLKKYQTLNAKDTAFDLRAFVLVHFRLPETPDVKVKEGLSILEHLEDLWNVLRRNADRKVPYSSLLPLPKPYIVPGGRFREIYYWDTYFTMQGLGVSNRYDMIESMIDNFKWLIDHYGHIPNGNRSYYLSRSQPPYFALMVELLAEKKGNGIYKKYYPAMEKEYRFWMNGADKLTTSSPAYRRLVKLPDGSILNRYYDDKKAPREESYAEDFETAKAYVHKDGMAYTNLRAGAESGWDFSSRWFADTMHLNTIETINIIPVDLNGLMYTYETILARAASLSGNKTKANYYRTQAAKRKNAIRKYCWNDTLKYYFDYDFKERTTTNIWSLAGSMALFANVATDEQAGFVQQHLKNKFLKQGGLTSTVYHTGQQWDAPNGWPPLQYIAVKGLLNYKHNDLAADIATRWMNINEKVFSATGKMMEKYNVENTQLESGGGEYPTQDGFGWTNGVYLKFYDLFVKKKTGLNR